MSAASNADRDFSLEYDQSWSKYDFIVNAFQLGRDRLHRWQALQFAGLKKGDIVLDVCCGSGLSFSAIEKIIGPEGKIVAFDANKHMLELARRRMQRKKWNNIELVHSDVDTFEYLPKADFAFFALCWYDAEQGRRWIRHISHSLKGDGTICFLDYQFPRNWLRHIANPILSLLVRWLGEAYSAEDLKWEPEKEIGSLLRHPQMKSIYLNSLVAVSGGIKE